MHSCHPSLSSKHTTEVRSLAQKQLCCPPRHHLTGPVRVPLRPSPGDLYISAFASRLFISDKNEDRAGFRFYLSFLSSHAAALTPGSRSVQIPITSRSTMAFAQNVGARRVACSTGRFIPLHPTLPAMRVGGYLSRSCSVHFTVTACEFGRPHRLGRTSGQVTTISPSGVPCRGKFRQHVATPTRPLPIQPNGILLN